jgi:hypothetical protein
MKPLFLLTYVTINLYVIIAKVINEDHQDYPATYRLIFGLLITTLISKEQTPADKAGVWALREKKKDKVSGVKNKFKAAMRMHCGL